MFLKHINKRLFNKSTLKLLSLRLLSNECPPPVEDAAVSDAIMDAKPNRFRAQCENQVNIQIGAELTASHTYFTMAAYCAQADVALVGAAG